MTVISATPVVSPRTGAASSQVSLPLRTAVAADGMLHRMLIPRAAAVVLDANKVLIIKRYLRHDQADDCATSAPTVFDASHAAFR